MSEQELTKDESLKLIADMIGQAKRNVVKGGSFYFLLWGWVVMLGNLGHFIIETYDLYNEPYIVWVITIPAAIISMIHGFMREQKATVVSHYDRIYSMLWFAVFIMIMITLIFMHKIGYFHNPIILMFSGLGVFISGFLLRFRPLLIGGAIIWIAALLCFFRPILDHYLIGAIAVILGYLVPGYLLRREEKRSV